VKAVERLDLFDRERDRLMERWTVRDRFGNEIYLTQERWEHIVLPFNHPERAAH
jgi:hypothetical protein